MASSNIWSSKKVDLGEVASLFKGSNQDSITIQGEQYTAVKSLGKGQFGRVVEVKQKGAQKALALKLSWCESYGPGYIADASGLEREVRFLKTFSATAVGGGWDYGWNETTCNADPWVMANSVAQIQGEKSGVLSNGTAYSAILTEKPDMSLQEFLFPSGYRRQVSLGVLENLFLQMSSAVELIHSSGVVHLDLSLSSFSVFGVADSTGYVEENSPDLLPIVKLSEFHRAQELPWECFSEGNAGHVLDVASLYEGVKIGGEDVLILSPESKTSYDNSDGATVEVSPSGDCWALGLCFYRMLNGELPGRYVSTEEGILFAKTVNGSQIKKDFQDQFESHHNSKIFVADNWANRTGTGWEAQAEAQSEAQAAASSQGQAYSASNTSYVAYVGEGANRYAQGLRETDGKHFTTTDNWYAPQPLSSQSHYSQASWGAGGRGRTAVARDATDGSTYSGSDSAVSAAASKLRGFFGGLIGLSSESDDDAADDFDEERAPLLVTANAAINATIAPARGAPSIPTRGAALPSNFNTPSPLQARYNFLRNVCEGLCSPAPESRVGRRTPVAGGARHLLAVTRIERDRDGVGG